MPSLYVHYSLGDMRDRVRRDAGVDDLGYRQAADAGDKAAALAALLRDLVKADPTQAAKTARPADWKLL